VAAVAALAWDSRWIDRLFNRQPPPQMDLYQYKVRAADGTMAQVNAPAAPDWSQRVCAADLSGRIDTTADGAVKRVLRR
jgi:hypothetical protein